MKRFVCVMVMALAATTACERKTTPSATGLQLPTRAASLGAFPDNPLVANIPADTPYALATFQPFPLELTQKFSKAAVPMWRKLLAAAPASEDATQLQIARDVLDALEHLDAASMEAHGFSAKARLAIYGLGPYPVMRLELGSGDKVFALVQQLATRWQLPLPAPTAHGAGRYWRVDAPAFSVVIAVLAKEFVVAAAPREVLDANFAQVLGEQKPAKAMTTAQFRAIAERDGYDGHAVGFADLVHIANMVAGLLPQPGCADALAGLARRVPRLTTGYGEISAKRMSFGMVAELSPEVLAEARTLTGKLAGLEQLVAAKPAVAFAAAVDVDRARIAAGHAAAVFADLGQRCDVEALARGGQEAGDFLARPLPPFVGGLHGGYFVATTFKPGVVGPEAFEGYGSLQIDNAGEVIKLAQLQLPTLSLPTDGKAHALPAEVAPVKGHAAANERAIGIAIGPTSQADALRGLGGTPVSAPLFAVLFDYRRLGELMPIPNDEVISRDDMMRMLSMFGTLIAQTLIDDRGVVTWWSMDLP